MAIESYDVGFATSQQPRTTPEIMKFIQSLFGYFSGNKNIYKPYKTGTTANLQAAYNQLKGFNYEDWAKGVQGDIQKADISEELEGLKAIPGTILEEYEKVLLPEFERTAGREISERFSGQGQQSSAYVNSMADAYAELFGGAQSKYLQSKADTAGQAVQYEVGAETDYTAALNQALVQLMSGQPGFMLGQAGVAGQLDAAQTAAQQQQVNPMLAMLAQLAQGFDPYNTYTTAYPKPPKKQKVQQPRNEHLVTGPPLSFGSTSTWMPGSFI